jgi:hypothetical protein
MGEVMSSILLHVVFFFSVNTQKDVVGITRHVVTTISAFSFTMLLLDRTLTHIVNHLSNTSYHFQYLYYPGGNETGAKPNLITCITEIFLSASYTATIVKPTSQNTSDRLRYGGFGLEIWNIGDDMILKCGDNKVCQLKFGTGDGCPMPSVVRLKQSKL